MSNEIIAYQFLPISLLPDCFAKTQLIELVIDPDATFVNVVATGGFADDWACYIGFPSSLSQIKLEKLDLTIMYYVSHVSAADDVADCGYKLGEDTASKIFPLIAACRSYRR